MDGFGEEPRLMRVQYQNLVVRRARRHEDGKTTTIDPASNIEDGERYEKLREGWRARRGLQASPTRTARHESNGVVTRGRGAVLE